MKPITLAYAEHSLIDLILLLENFTKLETKIWPIDYGRYIFVYQFTYRYYPIRGDIDL